MWKITLAVLFVITTAHADTTWINGPTVSGVWTIDGSPYILMDNVTVQDDSSLIIEPGVRVVVNGPFYFNVDGSFVINGSEQSPVVFTTEIELNLSGWRGLNISSGPGTVILTHMIVEWVESSGWGSNAAVVISRNATLDHVTVRDNDAYGLKVNSEASVIANDCIIERNGITTGGEHCAGSGGGLSLYNSNVELTRCRIANNCALDGGGFQAYGNTRLVLVDCILEENQAWIWGGGAFIDTDGEFMMSGCTVRNNSGITGSGMWIWGAQNVLIDRCVFSNNSERVPNGSGGGLEISTPSTITRCTFYGNIATQGSALLLDSEGVTFQNCIFMQNSLSAAIRSSELPMLAGYCNFFNNSGGNFSGDILDNFGNISQVNLNGDSCDQYFNIFMNPLFENPEEVDYHLSDDSPCIDAGDPDLALDPDSTIADIGAFYFPQEFSTIEPVNDLTIYFDAVEGGIILRWSEVNNAQYYIVYRSAESGLTQDNGYMIGETTTTEFTDIDALNDSDSKRFYIIIAANE